MRRTLIIAAVIVASTAVTVGIVKAASLRNVTAALGGVAGDYFELDGAMFFDSIKVGEQGVGGVTFFNGTIINQTTDSEGNDIPVTFGDNVRIDGRVYRGATAGPTDDQPFIVNDTMEVVGALTVSDVEGTDVVDSDNISDGTIVEADLADDAVTTDKVADAAIGTAHIIADAVTQTSEASGETAQTTTAVPNDYDLLTTEAAMTTSDSTALVMFSGVLSNDTNNSSSRIFLVVDDEVIDHTIRRGTSGTGGKTFSLAFNALVDVEAGDHTFQVGWNTDNGTTASIYNHTLDVIELKK